MATPTGTASLAASRPAPLPHELTAEWTVRAHLTFARAGEAVHKECGVVGAAEPVQPVRVVYKWCTPCDEPETEQDVDKTANTMGTSFRSTNSSATTTNADSAFGSPQASRALPTGTTAPGATAQVCGTRCRSTCNIMVSAVADFLPQEATTGPNEHEPFVYHNKVRAQQLRDAFSQTSDHEEPQQLMEPQQRRRTAYEQRRATTEALVNFATRRQAEEANTYVPTYSPTPTTPSSTFKSASMSRIPAHGGQQGGGTLPRMPPNLGEKKPRTVHIDVYCTGSEGDEEADDEQQADVEVSSSSSSDSDLAGSKRYDLDSNSTPQTVLDNEQMLLRHQRISGGAMPRRLGHQKEPKDNQQMSLGHAITKCSTAEEVTESKQLLFRKHIGDQRAAKLANLRQKYMRQPSDDTISSTYPNSSHSTMPRDATCSSISSVAAGTDCVDSSWKETEEMEEHPMVGFGLAKSDSFDYENSLDRLRISQMERLWSRQHSLDQPQNTASSLPLPHPQQHPHQQHLQTIKEVQSQRSSFQRSDTIPSESDGFSDTNVFNTYPGRQISQLQQRNRPAFLQFFGPSIHPNRGQPTPPVTAPVQAASVASTDPFRLLHPSYRWKSEARDNLSAQGPSGSGPSSERSSPQLLSAATTVVRCGSEAPPSTTSASTFGTTVVTPSPLPGRRFEISRDSPSVASEASTATVSGYTHEHLEKTRRFGNVVAMRKPGHHVGPTKNPNCQCESCQRWLAERFQLRGRAFSLGERPVLRRPQ
ncbi:uncharacterized protein LOC111080622 [Drosophila obscura]|uniref:uncharacterized protein LOC111080622 n=1 Tax=Drosophila obscura TaxID=7282 RepID=UPI001BB11A29|nr:uncharacterized protein LOC111080622 [Drosophila obscura]XP_041448961.1 uncharacterized protein LOC111080622 [Drosophila obscura]XP_041448962.1 uncharacterized protein LOC111080622 [Drosophila obscura]